MSLLASGVSYRTYGSITTPPVDTRSPNDHLNSNGEGPSTATGEPIDSGVERTVPERRQIGMVSAIFIIFNRIIGSGIFATPSTILTHSGSIGMSLIMWSVGAMVAAAGTQVYITWGMALPQNGGEKNYLEYLIRKPKYLISSIYAANGVFLAWTAGNSLVFGEYTLKALGMEPGRWRLRFVAQGCLTFVVLIHGTALRWGLCLQNLLGFFKLAVLLIVIGTGLAALMGRLRVPPPRNFDHPFEGTKLDAPSLCLCLYNILWSYTGFSNVNYALSEVENPKRTIRIAAPLAIVVVTVLYLLTNVAYFAGASKDEITGSGRLVAALLFRNVYGPEAERLLSAFVALCALGNILAVTFAHGRINQELGREGILPLSKFWASNLPFNAPLAGLWLHGMIGIIAISILPPGDAFNFLINTTSYPLSIINCIISFGVIYLSRVRPKGYPSWPHVGTYAQLAAGAFGAANTFLFVAPFIPPPQGGAPYENLPYWTHAVAGWAVLSLGFLYWVFWAVLLPWIGGYEYAKAEEYGDDGLSRKVLKRVRL